MSSTTTKTITYKVKLKKRPVKTYTNTLPTKTKTWTEVNTSDTAITTTTYTQTNSVTEKYVERQKYKTVTEKITITSTSTSTTITNPVEDEEPTDTVAWTGTGEDPPEQESEDYEADINVYASDVDSRVIYFFRNLNFKLYVKYSLASSYSGYMDAKNQNITITSDTSTVIYHELGHFLAFCANNYDRSAAFSKIYNAEKGLYTSSLYTSNISYVTASASEYFAESFREYCLIPATLKANRPLTYEGIVYALSVLTETQLARMWKIYGAFWS